MYRFLGLDPERLDGPATGTRKIDLGNVSVDWIANARTIFQRHSMALGGGMLPDAAELPNNAYLAQGTPETSGDTAADRWLGVRSPYRLKLAVGLGGDTAPAAIEELRNLLRNHPAVWDARYGILDSIHADLSTFNPPEDMNHAADLIRTNGAWVQQQVWLLNKGAALLALLNHIDDDTIRRTAMESPRIADGIAAIYGL